MDSENFQRSWKTATGNFLFSFIWVAERIVFRLLLWADPNILGCEISEFEFPL